MPVTETLTRDRTAAAPRPAPVDAAPSAAGVRLGAGLAPQGGARGPASAPDGCSDGIGYPPAEMARGVTGIVDLVLRVSDDGRVVAARVARSSGVAALDEWAQRGVRRCRFPSAQRDGRNVWGNREQRIVFRIN